MKARGILQYIFDRFWNVPTSVFIGLVVILCCGSVVFIALLGAKRGFSWSVKFFLLAYLIGLFFLAVLYRPVLSSRQFNFSPFWSYRALSGSDKLILIQIILNVVVFVPVGFLLGYSFDRMKWWKVLLVSGGLSLIIESLQFAFKRGFAEFDDVFHNVLGCMIGYGLYVAIAFIAQTISKKAIYSK